MTPFKKLVLKVKSARGAVLLAEESNNKLQEELEVDGFQQNAGKQVVVPTFGLLVQGTVPTTPVLALLRWEIPT